MIGSAKYSILLQIFNCRTFNFPLSTWDEPNCTYFELNWKLKRYIDDMFCNIYLTYLLDIYVKLILHKTNFKNYKVVLQQVPLLRLALFSLRKSASWERISQFPLRLLPSPYFVLCTTGISDKVSFVLGTKHPFFLLTA